MLEILREIILDHQEIELATGVPRELLITPVPGKATVCIGVRRCGKSTFMFQRMASLLEAEVSRQNILYLNFFDDRLHALRHDGLGIIVEAYYSLYPEKKHTEKVYCFFDEIQVVPGWEPFVDRIMRSENCEVYLTGSSAQMLSTEIATQMRGRALAWELFPFSFREFLAFKGINYSGQWSTKRRLLIQKAFEEFWSCGGFPEVAGLERAVRIRIHQEYFNAVLFRDLVERHDISHPRAVTDLAHRLVDNTASLYSINKLTGYLQSLGHKVPKTAVSDYLSWFEDAYFLFTVEIFDSSLSRRKANPKKVYCIDHSLVTSVASGILANTGHLLENLVFTALRRITAQVFYMKTRTGREVDFIALGQDGTRALVQVCDNMTDQATHDREVNALSQAMDELNLETSTIVTRGERGEVGVEAGHIRIVPVWQFLLEASKFLGSSV